MNITLNTNITRPETIERVLLDFDSSLLRLTAEIAKYAVILQTIAISMITIDHIISILPDRVSGLNGWLGLNI